MKTRFNLKLNKEMFTAENIVNASIYAVVFGLPVVFFLFLIQPLMPVLMIIVLGAALVFGGSQVGEALQRRRIGQ